MFIAAPVIRSAGWRTGMRSGQSNAPFEAMFGTEGIVALTALIGARTRVTLTPNVRQCGVPDGVAPPPPP